MEQTQDVVRQSMVPLEPLDLKKCKTVGDIVTGMDLCSFGARMLGETVDTLYQWVTEGVSGKEIKPYLVYDGVRGSAEFNLVKELIQRGWFEHCHPNQLGHISRAFVVGVLSGAQFDQVFKNTERAIFANDFGIAKPGQIIDGYFPDAVFCDTRFSLAVILAALDERINGIAKTVPEFLEETAAQPGNKCALEVLHGAQILHQMATDPECNVFLTLSGAMTAAQLGLVITDMLDLGMVNYISSTGALMAHGLVQGIGRKHYKYDPKFSDPLLAKLKLNRISDTLEPEENFTHVDEVMNLVLESQEGVISPSELHFMIGRHLDQNYPEQRAILKSAYQKRVPILVPAFHDSEIGNDVYSHNRLREKRGRKPLIFDVEQDSKLLVKMSQDKPKMGVFSIGGGVPRNNTQNVAPLLEIVRERMGQEGFLSDLEERQFLYGVKIAPDPLYYGNLGSATYPEAGSWRKADLLRGMFAMIKGDATQFWPFMVRHVMAQPEFLAA